MGHVYKEIELTWSKGKRVKALVDTSSTFIVLPLELAEEIGLPRSPRKVRVRLASGAEIEAEPGTVIVKVEGREAPATAIILAGVEPLLGAEALEALGLKVNPQTGELEPTRSFTVRA